MALCSADFEKGTQGNTPAIGDLGSATAWDVVVTETNSTIIYDNTHAHGARAAKFVTVTGSPCHSYLVWSTALGTVTDHYGRLYIYPTDLSAIHYFIGPTQASFTPATYNDTGLTLTGTGAIELRDSAATVQATTTTVVPLNAWSRIEYHFVHSTTVGSVEVKMFVGANAEGTVPDETKTASSINTNTNASYLMIGNGNNAATLTFWLDDIIAGASSYPGPVTTASAPFIPRRMPMGV